MYYWYTVFVIWAMFVVLLFVVAAWAHYSILRFPMLSRVARLLLAVPATLVSSERTFSEAKLIDTRLRSMLGDETFGDLVFISKNLPDGGNLDTLIAGLTRLTEVDSAAKKLFEELKQLTVNVDNDSDEEDDDSE